MTASVIKSSLTVLLGTDITFTEHIFPDKIRRNILFEQKKKHQIEIITQVDPITYFPIKYVIKWRTAIAYKVKRKSYDFSQIDQLLRDIAIEFDIAPERIDDFFKSLG